MLEYYGIELLKSLYDYYFPRYQLAVERGYSAEDNQYHWLCEELRIRTMVIRQTLLFLEVLPQFMKEDNHDSTIQQVVGFASSVLSEKETGCAKQIQKQKAVVDEQDSYYCEMQNALTHFDVGYDLKNLPLYYLDLCEYLVRVVRLYLHRRECYVHAIDRGKLDELLHGTKKIGA